MPVARRFDDGFPLEYELETLFEEGLAEEAWEILDEADEQPEGLTAYDTLNMLQTRARWLAEALAGDFDGFHELVARGVRRPSSGSS